MIRFVSEAEVAAILPDPLAAIELARRTLVALAAGDVDMPPKRAVHPRPDGFIEAMPAYCRVPDLAAVKLIAAYSGNRPRGLPAVTGVVVAFDAGTGAVRGIIRAAALTAARTAAASGACIARLAPPAAGAAAITGAGVEARSHLRVLEALGWHDVAVWDHRDANMDALEAWAAERVPAVRIRRAAGLDDVVDGAAVIVTGIPIGAAGGELTPAAIRDDALLLPIDYSTSVGAELAASAALVLADDVDQLEANRVRGHFRGWPALGGAVGAWLGEAAPTRPARRLLVANLGVGAHDVVFADAVLTAAERDGVGTVLPG